MKWIWICYILLLLRSFKEVSGDFMCDKNGIVNIVKGFPENERFLCNFMEDRKGESEICKDPNKVLRTLVSLGNFAKVCRELLHDNFNFNFHMEGAEITVECHGKFCGGMATKTYNMILYLKQKYDCMKNSDMIYMYSNLYFLMPIAQGQQKCKQQTYVFRGRYLYEVIRVCRLADAQKIMDYISVELDKITGVKCELSVFITDRFYSPSSGAEKIRQRYIYLHLVILFIMDWILNFFG